MKRIEFIKPGYFSPLQAAADFRRMEYDIRNESLLMSQTPIDFVFIGDSITQIWELDAYFHSKQGAIINRGIGGDVTQYVAKRFEGDALQLKPNHVVLLIGVNDTFKLEATMMPNRVAMTSEDVCQLVVSHMETIAAMCAERGQSLILCSILPTNRTASEVNQQRNECIVQINTHFQRIAEQHAFLYVDYHRHFRDQDGISLRPGYSDDALHPHALGYTKMAEVLKHTLSSANIHI